MFGLQCTVDVNKNVYKIIHRTCFNHHSSDKANMSLLLLLEDYNVLMLTSCKICTFVDYHVNGGR